MKVTFLILMTIVQAKNIDCDISEVRQQFHMENVSESRLENHISYMKEISCEEVTPYLASAIMQRAEHSSWPPSKLSYFNEGKSMLENYIENHPNDLEARYVRFLVQKSCPSFLGYKGDMETDKLFIKQRLANNISPSNLETRMISAIN